MGTKIFDIVLDEDVEVTSETELELSGNKGDDAESLCRL